MQIYGKINNFEFLSPQIFGQRKSAGKAQAKVIKDSIKS
jgi:hypothetical protein